jgi:hypothetical protein
MGKSLVKALVRRARIIALTVTAIVLALTTLGLVPATALTPNMPIPISSYGVATLYASTTMTGGTVNIRISTNTGGPFFVEKLLLMLQAPGQSDIVLDSLSINGGYTYSFSSYLAQRVVVVPTGTTIGDVVSSLPASLSILVVKDPLGNNAVFATGATNGLSFGIRYSTPLFGGAVSILVLVLAPSNATPTLTIS